MVKVMGASPSTQVRTRVGRLVRMSKVVSTSPARGSAYGSLRAGELTYTLEAASGGGTVLYSRQQDWFMQFDAEQDTGLYDLEDLFR